MARARPAPWPAHIVTPPLPRRVQSDVQPSPWLRIPPTLSRRDIERGLSILKGYRCRPEAGRRLWPAHFEVAGAGAAPRTPGLTQVRLETPHPSKPLPGQVKTRYDPAK